MLFRSRLKETNYFGGEVKQAVGSNENNKDERMMSADDADSSLRGGTNNDNLSNKNNSNITAAVLHHRTVRVLVATNGVTYKISLHPAEFT